MSPPRTAPIYSTGQRLGAIAITFIAVAAAAAVEAAGLRVQSSEKEGTLKVFRGDESEPILTQHARPGFRPYLHPIVAPDRRGVLTEASPDHHPHQTGLYWGFTKVNGRDYFHHPQGDYWRRVSAKVLTAEGNHEQDPVRWETVYDLLDEHGTAILTESQVWTMRQEDGTYVLDLIWTGHAKTDITIGKYDYGGLFLRMPWRQGVEGGVRNSTRQAGSSAEGGRAAWVDVGMRVEGRDDLAHIAIFDHPKNPGFPLPWRVDSQMGVGPVRARLGDWTIAKGERASIQHQAVVYTGKFDDAALAKKWSKYSGQTLASALFFTPEKAVASMTIPEGFEVGAYATEPMITQPMAFCWDASGRMWVAENRDYETRGTGFSNSGDSRILILEDTDRDGVADSRKVFLEGIPFPAAIAVGFDGLWLGAPPNLLFVPDRNADDLADTEDIEVRLTGWGISDRHETINSLMWGPDGWLYGCQGFATPSRVGKPVGEGRIYRHGEPFPRSVEFADPPVEFNGGVFRYHPLKRRFEVVAHGFSNPWGLDYDAKGQLFITACVIPHLWHVIPGGIYQRQGGSHFSPYVYSDITTIADHRHPSAHGGARIYQSDAFPDKYKDRIFMANIHQHAVLTDVLEPNGSGFIGRHGDDFLLANDPQWVGFSIEIGPEGAVFVLDWHDADICGGKVLNKETARIYRLAPTKSNARDWKGRYADLRQQPSAELVDLQRSASAWHARRARLILQERASAGTLGPETGPALAAMWQSDVPLNHRLRALWALHVIGAADAPMLLEALEDRDPHIRAWAIQLLCEDRAPPESAQQRFVALARNDPSPVVRLYLAAALQRVAADTQWAIAEQLALHAEDAEDHNIPKMLWFGIEPRIAGETDRSLRLAASTRLPLLTRHIARRLTDDGQMAAVVAAIGANPAARQQLLLGMRDGLEGRYDVRAPENWAAIYDRLRADGGESSGLALELAQQFGDNVAAVELLARLRDGDAAAEDRRRALQGLAGRKRPELKVELLALLDDDALRPDAIRAMAAYDDQQLASTLLKVYATLSSADKFDVVHTLASRRSYGLRLTQALRDGGVPKRDVPAYLARVLRQVVGNSFVDVWGPIGGIRAGTEVLFDKYRTLLTNQALAGADANHGRLVFNRTCVACHKLYGEGGAIGPELTGANRSNLEYLLGNILTPSAVIQDAYRMHIVLDEGGRTYSGIPADENERQLRLRVADQTEPVVIAKSQIELREIAPVSMMPDGLLANLTDEEVTNLIAYLQSRQQVALPTSGD